MWIMRNSGRSFIKTRERDKIPTCDGDDNIDTTKRERRHAPRPEAGSGRGTGMGKVGEGTRRPPMFVGLAEQIKLQCSDIIKVKITI